MSVLTSTLNAGQNLQKANLEGGFYNIINGKRVLLSGKLAVINPANGTELATVPDIDRDGLASAVAAARAAFPAWSATPYNQRRRQLAAVLEELEKHTEELCALFTAEQGRPLEGARWEIDWVLKRLGPALLKLQLPDEEHDSNQIGHVTVRYVPLGVVCAISPWNLPFLLSFTKVLPALLSGNTVVLKPSPFTPLTVLRTADYIRELLPAGVLNVITGGDDLGPWMTAHPGFDKIDFTGSTQTGKRVFESAAATLKHLTLELGGNDPGIVLPDADPKEIAQALFWSMFLFNGQGCITLKRLYVHEDIYDQLTKALVSVAQQVKTGDGFDPESGLGPVQNRLQYDRLQAVWKEIEQSGARILFKGAIPQASKGFFFPVTMVDNPPDHASFVAKEVFGPIRSILKYKNLDEAVQRANDTPYGLGASVWGKDPRTLRSVARRLNAGTVWINQHLAVSPEFPFGGHKESGIGVQQGLEGLRSYCNIQVIAERQ
jgi:acyl-CoA reductase-like NAD-dependent aldehyde dehydrogenase